MRKLAIILMLLVLAVQGCKKEEQKPITGGQGLMPPGWADKEIKALESILEEDPGNLNAITKLGDLKMDTGRYNEAVEYYSKALELDPSNVDVLVDRGVCKRRTGRPELAEKDFREAIKISPGHAIAHMNLGVVLAYDMRKYDEAAEMFEKYLELAPNAPNAEAIRNEIAKLKGNW
jgi:tetratricopeptide (TPR) repeat protein